MRRLFQQVVVLREKHAPQGGSTIEQRRIGERRGAVLGSRQNVHAPTTQPGRDRTMYMVIHVQKDGHQRFLRARKRSTIGGTGVCSRSSSTRARRRAISSSNSAW